ncbi:hypothetical protein [Streptomyces sp. NPDC088246]|uniref:hypothetical protein n=1 Tax=Streptomyces sp. NPDC088246 TaxID=3365842 RepID=UPI0037FF8034
MHAVFYVIGAAVLHPQHLVPEGNAVITTLSRVYTDTMGPWAPSDRFTHPPRLGASRP